MSAGLFGGFRIRKEVREAIVITVLGLTVVATEQYPRGLGATVGPVKNALAGCDVIEKTAFSCTGAPGFSERIRLAGIRQVIVCGVETHVCVNQTVCALLIQEYEVFVAADAVGSRKSIDHETALRRMEQAGAVLTTVEMSLFEMMGDARHTKFKEIQSLIK